MSSPLARPARSRSMPAQAIIAALSPHSAGGGATKANPAAAHSASRAVRIARLAATPPAATSVGAASGSSAKNRARARATRSASAPVTAAWKEAQKSATSRSDSGASAAAVWRTAVFRPEKEKSGRAAPFIGLGKAKRRGSPARAARSTLGPPGCGRPSILAVLSKASPSASSMVVAQRR